MDDWDLLEQFRATRSEEAFAELVRRHAGFVLATCRRRLRDAHLSEDTAQAVLLVLARRPPVKSSSNASLAGWLYKTAVYACNNAMRAQQSRAHHERYAVTTGPSSSEFTAAGIESADAEVLLDRALGELSGKERDAVLLRFYSDYSVQQVGAALGISPNSATKRIARAIERMREFLAGTGLTISPPALAEAIAQITRVPDVPVELVSKVVAVATGKSIATTFVQQLVEGVNHMIRVAQVKMVAAVAAVVLTAGGGMLAMNQLMAQSNASKPPTVASSNEPTIKPASAGAETPKAALRALAVAGRAADVEGMKMLVDIKNPAEEQLLLAACEYAGARKAFLEAVNARFGEPAMTRMDRGTLQMNLFDVFLKEIEKTETLPEQIEGSQATFAMGGQIGDVRLMRDDGGWRLSATNTTKDWPQAKSIEVQTSVQQGSAVLGRLTSEINAGKFAEFADLFKVVRGMRRGE